nr:cytochrome c peroxidase [Beijerinckia sp. L45]
MAGTGRSPAGSNASGAGRGEYRRPTETPYPDSNPYSAAKATLGRSLFYDTRISFSQTRSCASCHPPSRSWSDGLPIAQGEGASIMKLRTPTLDDIAWLPRLGWDGKFRDIESVTFGPILAPSNVHMTEGLLIERLSTLPTYAVLFSAAFPDKQINRRNIEMALATFERSIVSGVAPFDRWVEGDEAAIDEPAKRGFALFNGRANCSQCHSGWAFTDGSFHDIGVASGEEIGRGRYFPSSVKLKYAFKTPTLRDVSRRGPYMHDGSLATLQAVVDLYNKGGIDRPSRSELIKPLGLTETEKADLIAFLGTLSDEGELAAKAPAAVVREN